MLDALKSNNWVEKYTCVEFIEFTVYNMQLSKPVEQNCGTASLQTLAINTPLALLNPLLEIIF